MKLRSHLLLLAISAVLPFVVFAATIATLLVERERQTFLNSAMERTRALMTAVDSELRGTISTLGAVATSRSLRVGDLAAFHAEIVAVLASQPDWHNVILSSHSGQQLVNAAVPFGSPLPVNVDLETTQRVVETRAPAIGRLSEGPVIGRLGVPIRVPVLLEGRVAYVLTAFIKPQSLATLLKAQRLPEDWVLAVADRQKRFVARVPSRPPGDYASKAFSAALERAPEGTFRGRTVEGVDTFQSYSRSSFSGFGVGIAVPAREVEAVAWRTVGAMAAGIAAAMGLALALAAFLARGIVEPMTQLAARARAIGQGNAEPLEARARVNEVREVANALKEAGDAVRNREETQKRAEMALREANRSKDEFLATLSHELRNPLAAISMSAPLLRSNPGNEGLVLKTADVLERQSAQMTHLVEDLLDLSRVTFGKISVFPAPMDLAVAAERLFSTWQSAGRFGRHEVRLDTSPAWISGDAPRIEQIIGNLLDNALKFTPPGGRIAIRVAREGATSRLEIADSGTGLPLEIAHSLFDAFVQGEQALDRPSGGLGIGLALVRKLVEMHAATVEALSEGTGRGATFIVRFAAIEPPPEATTSVPAEGAASARRILLVEDNEDTRCVLLALLQTEGHQVKGAHDAASALAALPDFRPEVVLVDIGLPGVSGYELANLLRARLGSHAHLVALTGYGAAEDRLFALEAGFDDHLTKPAALDTLRGVLAMRARQRADRE
ncbi:MAG: ATP-binding protein [Pseudomonadota bacterium]|nr:ATP-binding protein [Pseudomonadota bacterium]